METSGRQHVKDVRLPFDLDAGRKTSGVRDDRYQPPQQQQRIFSSGSADQRPPGGCHDGNSKRPGGGKYDLSVCRPLSAGLVHFSTDLFDNLQPGVSSVRSSCNVQLLPGERPVGSVGSTGSSLDELRCRRDDANFDGGRSRTAVDGLDEQASRGSAGRHRTTGREDGSDERQHGSHLEDARNASCQSTDTGGPSLCRRRLDFNDSSDDDDNDDDDDSSNDDDDNQLQPQHTRVDSNASSVFRPWENRVSTVVRPWETNITDSQQHVRSQSSLRFDWSQQQLNQDTRFSRNEQQTDSGYSSILQSHQSQTVPEKKSNGFSVSTIRILESWYSAHSQHPYPDELTLTSLAVAGCITVKQARKWLANRRVRSHNTLKYNGSIHPKRLRRLQRDLAAAAAASSTHRPGTNISSSNNSIWAQGPETVQHQFQWHSTPIPAPLRPPQSSSTAGPPAFGSSPRLHRGDLRPLPSSVVGNSGVAAAGFGFAYPLPGMGSVPFFGSSSTGLAYGQNVFDVAAFGGSVPQRAPRF